MDAHFGKVRARVFAHRARIGSHHKARFVAARVAVAGLELGAQLLGELAASHIHKHGVHALLAGRVVIQHHTAQDLHMCRLQVRVDHDGTFEPLDRERLEDVVHQNPQRAWVQRHAPCKASGVLDEAIGERRQHKARDARGMQLLCGAARLRMRDGHIGVERQVRAMRFGAADRQDRHRLTIKECLSFRPCQLGQVMRMARIHERHSACGPQYSTTSPRCLSSSCNLSDA